ncbi:hypothetical protein DM02DRAFT_612466 [Periconia macrospinosa]|uniref:Secreted protein NIS1 n=1 Tax=Periconia macrospinosa TaxID=97972 RepID=A0A2V1DYF4_9PLEO|nr:hypothetical protein DM02DRAFT_612466 [Periconia macrospinosa]
MRASTLLTILAPLATTTARITGISAPSEINNSSSFDLILQGTNYIQTVADISVAWGYSLTPGFFGTLGSEASSVYLGPEKSNKVGDIVIQAPPPQGLALGRDHVLAVAVTSLYGASGTPTVTLFNVTLMMSNRISGQRSNSTGFESFTAYS